MNNDENDDHKSWARSFKQPLRISARMSVFDTYNAKVSSSDDELTDDPFNFRQDEHRNKKRKVTVYFESEVQVDFDEERVVPAPKVSMPVVSKTSCSIYPNNCQEKEEELQDDEKGFISQQQQHGFGQEDEEQDSDSEDDEFPEFAYLDRSYPSDFRYLDFWFLADNKQPEEEGEDDEEDDDEDSVGWVSE